jgi:hypothetical protein
LLNILIRFFFLPSLSSVIEKKFSLLDVVGSDCVSFDANDDVDTAFKSGNKLVENKEKVEI